MVNQAKEMELSYLLVLRKFTFHSSLLCFTSLFDIQAYCLIHLPLHPSIKIRCDLSSNGSSL